MTSSLTILTGASRGMGLAMAHALLAPGARLLCISRTSNAVLANVATAKGAHLEQWRADLTDAQPVAERLGKWLAALGKGACSSATLINNAGAIPALVPMADSDPADLARCLRVGLEAPMLLTAAFLHATEHWSISLKVLNISSGLGQRAMASQAGYCAVKAGMDHFTRCLALDEARKPHGALVCSLAPGVIDTDMQRQLRSADAALFPDQDAFASLHSNGRLTSPPDAARMVLDYLERPDFGRQPVADVRG